MRSATARSGCVTVPVLLLALAAGPALGLALSARLAAGSELAAIVAAFAFPLAFFIGLFVWLGVGIAQAAFELIRGRGRPARPEWKSGEEVPVPTGHGAFVPLCLVAGLISGPIVGILSSTHSVLAATAAFVAAGLAYGAGLSLLARVGWLPFPVED